MQRKLLQRLGMATLSFALTVGITHAAVAQCNEVNFEIAVAPDNQQTLPLYWFVQSSCPASPRICGSSPTPPGRLEVPPGTTRQAKCQSVFNDISNRCTGPGSAGFQITSNCNHPTNPSFTIRDPLCPNSTSQILAFGISNESLIFTTNQDVWQRDYELDLITPGCAAGSGSMSLIKGTPTGLPFVPGTPNANVVMMVDARGVGGTVVSQQEPTAQKTASQVVLNLTNAVNQQLTQTQTPVRCEALGRGVRCRIIPTGGPAALAAELGDGVPVALQSNDTGVSRGAISGSDAMINAFAARINNPGQGCPTFSQCNVVTAAAASSVPSLSEWALVLLLVSLLTTGVWFGRKRPGFSSFSV